MSVRERDRDRGPVRTCCGCGARDAQGALIRITASAGGELIVDPGRRRGGRGAYLHPRPACWEGFVRGKLYLRSLRMPAGVPARRALVEDLSRIRAMEEGDVRRGGPATHGRARGDAEGAAAGGAMSTVTLSVVRGAAATGSVASSLLTRS